MISTLDGKIVPGVRGESASSLGSSVDHEVMKMLAEKCDAVILGAGTVRAVKSWGFASGIRVVISESGRLDYNHPFFSSPSAYVASTSSEIPKSVGQISTTKPSEILGELRNKLGVNRCLLLGGGVTNASFFAEDLVDEFFLTIAPKVKMGADTPTAAEGEPLPESSLLEFQLLESHSVGNEVFLRYVRKR